MMKFIKWKPMLLTCLICLLPIAYGVFLWDKLPDTMAIHFNLYNEPDGFASKTFVVFGLPVMMVILQAFCCVASDIKSRESGVGKKFETVTKAIIPVMTVILYVITLEYGMGKDLDIRKIAVLLVGFIFIVTGNYLPKVDYIKNFNVSKEKARKINRILGYETVVMGVLFVISAFMHPIASAVCLGLMIPYTIIGILFGIKEGRKNDV